MRPAGSADASDITDVVNALDAQGIARKH